MSETGTTQEQSEAQPVPPFRPNLDIITTMERDDPLRLTRPERQIIELAAKGLTNREIATALYVTSRTVEVHLARIFGKLGVTSRARLARVLHREGSAERDEQPDEAGPEEG